MLATKPDLVENSRFRGELRLKSCNLSCSQRACTVCGSGMKSCNLSCSQRACTVCGSGMKSCNLSCSQRACTVFGSGMKSCNGSCSQRCYLEKKIKLVSRWPLAE